MRETRTALLLVDTAQAGWSCELQDEMLLLRAHRTLDRIFDRVVVVAPDPTVLQGLGLTVVPDEYPGSGLLGAIASGLKEIRGQHAFVTAADMPFLEARLARYLFGQRAGWDVVLPKTEAGFEPLCGVYSRSCVAPMEERIRRGKFKLLDFISEVRVRIVSGEDLSVLDSSGSSFRNVHTAADLDECRLHLARLRGYGPPAVSFVARSGTGKTTLLERVIRELSGRGYRLGTIKHDAHRFEIDHEGKDSWRLTRAGASPMVISSAEKVAMVHPNPRGEMPLEEVICRYMTDVDLVVTEGYRTGTLPRIEVHRAEAGPELLCASSSGELRDQRLLAVASDEPLILPVPLFPLDDPVPLCDFLEGRFLSGA